MRFCIMSSHLPLFSFTRMLDFSIPKRIETGQLFVAYLFFMVVETLGELNWLKGCKISDNVGGSVDLSNILYVEDTLTNCDIDK